MREQRQRRIRTEVLKMPHCVTNTNVWSGTETHVRGLLYVHMDRKLEQQGKGGGGVKHPEGFRSKIFISPSKHLWLEWRWQKVILNIIRVNC